MPEQINSLCKQGIVEITISVLHPEDEEVQVMRDGEWITCRREKINLARGTTIRSWSDLFQIDNKYAIYLGDKLRSKSLK
jgi:NDP-sugar pyrophosphorylase family protein